jgi:N utilization substance protein B
MRFRRRARDLALLTVYRWDLRSEDVSTLFQEIVEEKGIKRSEVKEYAKRLIETLMENLTYIDSLISQNLEDWRFDRLGYIERNALRLAIAELLFMKPPDPGRVFSDYIDIVKKYADSKASRFFNGVLSSVYKNSRATSSARK